MSHKKSWSRVQDHDRYRETMERLYPDKRPAPAEPPVPEPDEPTEPLKQP